MNILPTTLILLALALPTLAVKCEATHFDFTGTYSLGKQDELNRTFTKIQENFPILPNATDTTSESITYTIYNVKTTFYYRDSKQAAEIASNNTIIIEGGKLEADLTFQWRKNTSNSTGSGAAFGLSDTIVFSKVATIGDDEGSFLSYDLQDFWDIAWTSQGEVFQLTRVDPATASDYDKKALTSLLNNIKDVKTVRLLLEEELHKVYQFTLRNSLHDQHQPIDNHFDYIWAPGNGKPNVTVPFTRRATAIDLEQYGLRLRFQVQAANAKDWRCGNRSLPKLELSPKVYGSTQEFVSYDFYQNVIRHAIDKNLLDSDLAPQEWQSRMFQFFAGDLYEVFGKVQERYWAYQPVTGSCKATYIGLKIWKSGQDTFNVTIPFDCELSIRKDKVANFHVGLDAEIEAIPQATSMDFKFRRHTEFITFYQYGEFSILNKALGEAMIKHSLNRLYGANLFGSGWPMSPPRDYPHVITEENCTVVYDSTHVDPHATRLNEL